MRANNRRVFIYMLGKLYESGRISGVLGAQVLGCDRWEFYRLLSENGFAVIDYADDELEHEAAVGEPNRQAHRDTPQRPLRLGE